ncbi:MAG TPA: hypothetical protein VMW42_00665 [Desulfatiglandales bacterium]|nr:hypothetical protein [Desulfatiglandales bacterium]
MYDKLHTKPKQNTINRKLGLRKISWAPGFTVRAFNGCHKTNKTALTKVIKIMNCLPFSFALLGIKTPRKKASSRSEGNINNENGNTYTKLDLIIPNSNSFE